MDWYSQIPTWMRQQQAPNPFEDVLNGKQSGGFNPGGQFGAGIPSVQRFNQLAPSEQQGLQGYYADQLGVNPQDVMWQMHKLAPQRSFNSVPRWVL